MNIGCSGSDRLCENTLNCFNCLFPSEAVGLIQKGKINRRSRSRFKHEASVSEKSERKNERNLN